MCSPGEGSTGPSLLYWGLEGGIAVWVFGWRVLWDAGAVGTFQDRSERSGLSNSYLFEHRLCR